MGMHGQISLFDYMDKKQNINIVNPHIAIENLYVAPLEPLKPKTKKRKPRRKRGNRIENRGNIGKGAGG